MIDDDADPETLRQFFSRTPEEIEEKKRQKWNEDWNALRMPEHLARVADTADSGQRNSAAEVPHRWVKGRWMTAPTAQSFDAYQRALMDTIGGTEAPDYDILYSPVKGQFRRIRKGPDGLPDYRSHPNDPATISSGPNARKASYAAGRYQIIKSTWDRLSGSHKDLTDFRPPNQDRGAWYLAAEVYGHDTGRDLAADLRDPRHYPTIAGVLRGQWTSLPGGIEQRQGQSEFDRRLTEGVKRHQGRNGGVR